MTTDLLLEGFDGNALSLIPKTLTLTNGVPKEDKEEKSKEHISKLFAWCETFVEVLYAILEPKQRHSAVRMVNGIGHSHLTMVSVFLVDAKP